MNKEKANDILDKKIANGREYRRTRVIETRAGEDTGEGEKIVRGYATVFDEDYLLVDWGDYKVYERISASAFDDCDMSDVIMQYDHVGRVFARNSNDTLTLETDERGLAIEANLGGTEIGRQLYEEIAGGYTNKMSFGFTVGEDERTIVEDHENNVITVYRNITKISKLYDVSAVSLPANDATEISARGYCDGVIAELRAERLRAEELLLERRRAEVKARALLGGKN